MPPLRLHHTLFLITLIEQNCTVVVLEKEKKDCNVVDICIQTLSPHHKSMRPSLIKQVEMSGDQSFLQIVFLIVGFSRKRRWWSATPRQTSATNRTATGFHLLVEYKYKYNYKYIQTYTNTRISRLTSAANRTPTRHIFISIWWNSIWWYTYLRVTYLCIYMKHQKNENSLPGWQLLTAAV